jgi:uridine phosphorylase
MEWHIQCDPAQIARYVFCPGDHNRAGMIADHFEGKELVSSTRGYVVYSGQYEGVHMTSIGTGMGGPAVAIALEELAHMGSDTFIRVGSCGVFQPGQQPGDVIIASGTVREGGTGDAYLPRHFPAVATYQALNALAEAAKALNIPTTVGVGVAGDAFYAPHNPDGGGQQVEYGKVGMVFIEMESDTLFIVGQYRGWRTGAIFAADGTPGEIKPAWGHDAYVQGQQNAIRVALRAMRDIARADGL